jgi:hypothetical protein
MYLAVRSKVRCTVCHEVFQNDYVGKHTKSVPIDLDKSDTRQSKAVNMLKYVRS